MNSRHHDGSEADAADWVVRLSEGDGGEADWVAFQAWLDAAPGNRAAFDAAQTLWLEIDRHAAVIAAQGVEPLAAQPSRRPTRRSPARRPNVRWLGALAATLAAMFVGVAAFRELAPTPVEHQTGPAERRTVALADGSKVSLNGNSKIVVRYNSFGRKVELSGAEAAFDVVPDRRRPFTVAVNDATVQVVGTEFNVRRDDGDDFTVTVRRGAVQVAPIATPAAQAVRLVAGQQLVSHGGQYRLASTAAVDDAFSWRQGQLVYRMRPLAEVVADLNRFYSQQIVLSSGAARLNFSGVLTMDGEEAVVSRLCELLPLQASRQNGSILLEARQAAH